MTQTRFQTTLAKPQKSARRRALALGSLVGHIAAGGVLLALSFWEIQELQRPHRGVAIAAPLSIAAPSGGGSSAEPEKVPERVVEKKPTAKPRQPQARTDESRTTEASTSGDAGDGMGTGSGSGQGPGEGDGPGGLGSGGFVELCVDPDLCGELPPAPTVPDESPIDVPEAELGKLRRRAGDPQVQPPSSTKNAMFRKGERRVVALILMCLDKRGEVSKTKLLRSSGYPEYDAKLRSSMRSWKYEPYQANGRPAAICAPLTFVYQQE